MQSPMSDEPTAYAIICATDGRVFLTKEEYDRQLSCDEPWHCPICGHSAQWDDANYESHGSPDLEEAIAAIVGHHRRAGARVGILGGEVPNPLTQDPEKARLLARVIRKFADEVEFQQQRYRTIQDEHNRRRQLCVVEGVLLDRAVLVADVIAAQDHAIEALRQRAQEIERKAAMGVVK